MIGAAALEAQLPGNYVAQTTSAQRTQHFELYKRYEASTEEVLLSWAPLADGSANTELHAVFAKRLGELSTITTALNEKGIRVVRCVTFATNSGVAIDTFELTSFDQEAANHVKTALTGKAAPTAAAGGATKNVVGGGAADELVRQLPADYVTSTTPADRLAHLELYRRYSDSSTHGDGQDVHISWRPASDGTTRVTLYAIFQDVVGSLSTITAALAERGINIVRVSCFNTEAGVAIDSFELNDFDEPSADLLRLRLHALIMAGSPEAAVAAADASTMALRKSKTSGATAVAFRVTWKAQKGDSAWLGQSSKRGRQELVVGDVWASIGQASFEADALRFVQPDFQEPSTLHLGFVHLRKERSIALQFAEGPEHCNRALALLSRFARSPSRGASAHDGQRYLASTIDTGTALQRAAPTAAKQPSPGSDDEVPGFTFSFYVPQSDWPMWAVVLRNAAIAALAVCLLVAAHAHLSFKHLDESNFELATCTVLHPTTSIDHLDADQRCYGHPVVCHRSFFVVHPAWQVTVEKLVRYEPTKLVESPPKELLRQPTDSHAWAKSVAPPAPSYKALLLPSVLLPHKHARPMEHDLKIDSKGSIGPGVYCAGRLGWSSNTTLYHCHSRAPEWLPRMSVLRGYPCYAPRADGSTAYLSIDPPPMRSVERTIVAVAALLALAAAAGHYYLVRRIHNAPRRLTVAAAEGANKEAADARRLNHVGGLKGLRSLGGGSERSASETSSTSAPSTPSVPRRKSLLASAASLVSPRRGSTNGNELM